MLFTIGGTVGVGASGDFQFDGGSASGSGDTGNFLVSTGGANSGNSGDIRFFIGSSTSGTRGKIKLVDGSEGTIGHVWTSVDANGSGEWAAISSPTVDFAKETIVLDGTDITNQYIDLAVEAKVDSIQLLVAGAGAVLEGASYQYSVSYTGGPGGETRITFLNELATGGASELVATDVLQIQYMEA
jgi:hypothetical protein